jgi:predicted ATPase
LKTIRKALGDDSKEPRFIQTYPKRGYRFIAAVSGGTSGARASNRVVGREATLSELRSCVERVMAGERQIVFINGEAGIGKTTLVDVFENIATNALPGIRVARGQCVEGYGSKEAYYPVLEALGRLTRGARGQAVIDALAAHAPTWLVQFPALLKPEHRATLQREILGATRDRMLREIRDLLETIAADHPLILLLDSSSTPCRRKLFIPGWLQF